MRVFIGATVLCGILTVAPGFAQAPAPAQPAQAEQPVQLPFPAGTKYAFVNIPRIFAESAAGMTLTGKLEALQTQRLNELNERNVALQAAQQKLDAGATVMSPTAAAQLQRDIERQQIDVQRFTEDAQQEVTTLQTQLQQEFELRLGPVIQEVAVEHELELLFSVTDSGLIFANESLDVTNEVIQKFDALGAGAGTPAPAASAAPAVP